MTDAVSRRSALVAVAGAISTPLLSAPAIAASDIDARLAAIEKKSGGRLGVSVVDTQSGQRFGRRANERFALCSTFKFLAAAFVLARVDRGEEKLERRIVFSKSDLVAYSPAIERRLGGEGVTMAEICEAAVTLSDNAAGNAMLASFGGPAGLTAYLRALGDKTSRLDRIEPGLNEARPGDPRDTTTPAAMAAVTLKLLIGDALSQPTRDLLIAWLVGNKTGDTRLRAGLPPGWRVGDKTGSGNFAVANDVAIVWPPERKPLVIAAYFAESKLPPDGRNAVLAEVGRVAAQVI